MMKRFIASISCLLFLSVIFIGFLSNSSSEQCLFTIKEREDLTVDSFKPEEYFEIPDNVVYDHVYLNSLNIKEQIQSSAKIETCEIPVCNSSYKGGDIIQKGVNINGCIYDSRIRVNKYDGSTIYGDLIDNTAFSFLINEFFIPVDISSISIKATWHSKELDLHDISIEYENGIFKIKAISENNGEIFTNQDIYVFVSYNTTSFDGLFVNKKAVYEDLNGYYVQQIIFYKKTKYFKKTYIDVVDEISGYYKIRSQASIADISVCYFD